MFSGIGGFELGIEKIYDYTETRGCRQKENIFEQQSGNLVSKSDVRQCSTCIGYSEIDKYAIQIYRKHFPERKNYGNATKLITRELPNFDLLVAGFPCQAFSYAGKRQGFNDSRGTLFFEIARILRNKRPRYLLLENVKGFLNHDKGKTFQTILGVLSDLGYGVEWQVLNSKHFGVPQNRERVFIIGHLGGESGRKVFPIEGSSQEDNVEKQTGQISEQVKATQRLSDAFKIRDTNGVSATLKGLGGGMGAKTGLYATPRIRRLTPTECERLQGFPDGWTEKGIDNDGNEITISDTQRYKCLGNAVTVNVITHLISFLMEHIGNGNS